MSLKHNLLGAVAAAALLTGAAGTAQASIIVLLDSVTTASPGVYSFNYSATLSSDQQLKAGAVSQFTLYDFGPYVGALPASATGELALFTFSSSLTSSSGSAAVTAPDNATVLNINAQITPAASFSDPTGTSGNLGTFSILTIYSQQVLGSQTGQAYKLTTNPLTNGTLVANFNSIVVPVPTPAPEPASLALIGAGMAGLGLLRRRKRA